MQKPSIGRIVHYVLTEDDATQINKRRADVFNIRERLVAGTWPLGAQAHVGNKVSAGQHVAVIVTGVWGTGQTVNGQAILDGNDSFWVLSALEGEGPRTWHWPERED